jgi:hypothetical protein
MFNNFISAILFLALAWDVLSVPQEPDLIPCEYHYYQVYHPLSYRT